MTDPRTSGGVLRLALVVVRAGTIAALTAAAATALMVLPMAIGAASIAETLLAVLLLAFMLALPGMILVGFLLALLGDLARPFAPNILGRPLRSALTLSTVGAAFAALSAFGLGALMSIPMYGNGGVNVRLLMTFGAAIGGIVLGTLLARRLR